MQIAQHHPDSNGDGQTNAQEATLGTNPTNTDTDQDGLTDLYELLQTGTSTNEADTDGDGSNDQEEITAGTDPLNPDSIPVTPPNTPVAAPSLQTVALITLSILFLGIGFTLIKRGIHTPALFFIGVGLLCIPNAHKQNSDDHPFIKSAYALPSVSGQLYFVHTDSLGTPYAMTDRSAAVVWQATYTPFGKATVNEDPDNDGKLVENNIRFPGQYFDEETGGHYNGARYYLPEDGRYLTSDHIGLFGGINTYSYAELNPILLIDPSGLVVSGEWASGGRPRIVEESITVGLGIVPYSNGLLHVFAHGIGNVSFRAKCTDDDECNKKKTWYIDDGGSKYLQTPVPILLTGTIEEFNNKPIYIDEIISSATSKTFDSLTSVLQSLLLDPTKICQGRQ